MNFALTDEQRLLRDTVQRFVTNEYGFERRQQLIKSDDGFSRDIWKDLANLGLLALNIPETYDGVGAGTGEMMLVSQVLGPGLLLEPYLSSAVLATKAIVKFASDAQQAEWLPQMAGGNLIAVLAHQDGESATPYDETSPTTRAWRAADGWVLSGKKSAIYHAPIADLLLISATIDTPAGLGVGLFSVPVSARGVNLQSGTAIDGQCVADIGLNEVYVSDSARLSGVANAGDISDIFDFGIAALCAEAVGILQALQDMTVEYSRTRTQFGVPIGKFQALQHKLADMLMHVEQARSMAYLAASVCDECDRGARQSAISATKVVVSQAARFVGQHAVQLHGGMGMTDELVVSHYFKRLLAIELCFGTGDAHLERYARQLSAA